MAYQKSFSQRLIYSLARFILICAILALGTTLLWRMCVADTLPRSVKTLIPTDSLVSLYQQNGGLEGYYQEYGEYTYNDDAYGYFSVPLAIYFPDAEEWQIVVRYNNSTLTKIAEDLGLTEAPHREDNVFDVTLLVTHTGEDADTRLYPDTAETVSDATGLYNYRRYVFHMTMDDTVEGVFADFYFTDETHPLNYEESPLGAICFYDGTEENLTYRLTAKDKKALEQ